MSFQTLSVAHVASPCVTMFVLALVHSQIMAIYETSQYSQFKAKTKSKRYILYAYVVCVVYHMTAVTDSLSRTFAIVVIFCLKGCPTCM